LDREAFQEPVQIIEENKAARPLGLVQKVGLFDNKISGTY
jgi:hypothetical protein